MNKENSRTKPKAWATYEKYGDCATAHNMYKAYVAKREFAKFRNEGWDLLFEDWMDAWTPHWKDRGRKGDNYQITRINDQLPWSGDNIMVDTRLKIARHTSNLLLARRGS
jgi:hypothetical protein